MSEEHEGGKPPGKGNNPFMGDESSMELSPEADAALREELRAQGQSLKSKEAWLFKTTPKPDCPVERDRLATLEAVYVWWMRLHYVFLGLFALMALSQARTVYIAGFVLSVMVPLIDIFFPTHYWAWVEKEQKHLGRSSLILLLVILWYTVPQWLFG